MLLHNKFVLLSIAIANTLCQVAKLAKLALMAPKKEYSHSTLSNMYLREFGKIA